jgi:hypothetical protein
MKFYRHPEPFWKIRQLYWTLRNRRAYDFACKQRCYRAIRSERLRLEAIGFSAEHLRLYCRYMSNPQPQSPALHRLETFEAMLVEFARIQTLAKSSSFAVCPQKTGAFPILHSMDS